MAILAIVKGVRPKKPYLAENLGFTDGLWGVIERSWILDADARPDARTMLRHLARAASTWDKRQPV
jgi:hypothetical protein